MEETVKIFLCCFRPPFKHVKLLQLTLFAVYFFVLARGQPSVCRKLRPSPTLRPFVDALTVPPRIYVGTETQVVLGAYKIQQKLHRDLPPTTLYAFGTQQTTAQYPGPILEARRYVPATVRWENHLQDEEHFLTVDKTIYWADPKNGGVPISVHLHGHESESKYDGHPEAWFTAKGETGPTFVTQNFHYNNEQRATMLWYHDHTIGITRLNVVAGLAGFYIIRSPTEEPTGLPLPNFEFPLLIQDKSFSTDGSINFPNIGGTPSLHPHWCFSYFGDVMIVNGKIWPILEVEPCPYRFRFLNGCNNRFLVLSLRHPTLYFIQIGTDGGFLPRPQNRTTLTMAPAERVDCVVDFGGLAAGDEVVLQNTGAAPYPTGEDILSPPGTRIVLKFRVTKSATPPMTSPYSPPSTLVQEPRVVIPSPGYPDVLTRRLFLIDTLLDAVPILLRINNLSWTDPVTETPQLGSTEVWEIVNPSAVAHPIHIHLSFFRVINQQSYNQTKLDEGDCTLDDPYPDASSCFTEAARGPEEYQEGWKDTAIVWPGNVTRFWLRFTTQDGSNFTFDATSPPGYLFHCHILDHEDHEMMRPMQVLNSSALSTVGESPFYGRIPIQSPSANSIT